LAEYSLIEGKRFRGDELFYVGEGAMVIKQVFG